MGRVHGWLPIMVEKEGFGEITARDFQIGDIVEWTTWSENENDWSAQYGVLLSIENKIKSNRIVSVSKVVPLNEPHTELEFFTLTLKIVNKE